MTKWSSRGPGGWRKPRLFCHRVIVVLMYYQLFHFLSFSCYSRTTSGVTLFFPSFLFFLYIPIRSRCQFGIWCHFRVILESGVVSENDKNDTKMTATNDKSQEHGTPQRQENDSNMTPKMTQYVVGDFQDLLRRSINVLGPCAWM